MRAKTYTEYLDLMILAHVTPMSESDWNARNIAIPQSEPEMKKCDCGHIVSKNLVMNANLGTSCPDCYDGD